MPKPYSDDFADARGREGAGGRQPPECCEAVAGGRVEPRLDLALPESLRHHPQEAGARRGRARTARRAAPPRAVDALSGPGGPAQAGLHRRDLHEDQHVAQTRLGPQGTKGSRLGPLRPLGNLLYLGCAILLPPPPRTTRKDKNPERCPSSSSEADESDPAQP